MRFFLLIFQSISAASGNEARAFQQMECNLFGSLNSKALFDAELSFQDVLSSLVIDKVDEDLRTVPLETSRVQQSEPDTLFQSTSKNRHESLRQPDYEIDDPAILVGDEQAIESWINRAILALSTEVHHELPPIYGPFLVESS